MATFQYKGKTYFYAHGKWVDSMSKPVPADLKKQLDEEFPNAETKKDKTQRTKSTYRGESNYFSPYYSTHNTTSMKKSTQNATFKQKATVRDSHIEAQLTAEQKSALHILESGENVFLSGEAGTGKSFVLNEYIKRNRDKNVIVCAPTGVAAINVGGATMHRVFDIPIAVTKPGDFNHKPSNPLIEANTIVIDEISMCRFDIFEYVIRTIRRAEEIQQMRENVFAMENGREPRQIGSKQLIVVGDFYQLAPVVTSADKEVLSTLWNFEKFTSGFAFESDMWREQNFKCIILKEIIRQSGDSEYIENLNKIRNGDSSGIQWFNTNVSKIPIPNGIYLCGTNRDADFINMQETENIMEEPVKYMSKVEGQVRTSDKVTSDELVLKVGMQVMTLVNNVQEGYQNGSIGKVVELKENYVKVKLNTGKIVQVGKYEWEILGYEVQEKKVERVVLGKFAQIPLKIAYAITIHKSQGQTYSSVNVSPVCFAPGQLYVALSRAKSIEGMSLTSNIERSALRTSPAVKRFYESIQSVEINI